MNYTPATILFLAMACTVPNPNYRPPRDAAVEEVCESSASCNAPTSVCNGPTGKCVQCTASDKTACAGRTPVCGADLKCEACSSHSQCPTNVCLPDGSCSTGLNVAYVDPAGSGSQCKKNNPCASLQAALKANQPFIKITGDIKEAATVDIVDRSVHILADDGARLIGATPVAIGVSGNSQVSIYDLEVTGSIDAPDGSHFSGAFMTYSDRCSLSLYRVKVRNNAGYGVFGQGGTLSIRQSVLANNRRGGVLMTSPMTFHISNSFIVKNGSPSSAVGAIHAVSNGNSALEFNTIVDNVASSSASQGGGVVCQQAGLVADNNLIFRNTGGSADVQFAGECLPGNSLLMSPPDPGFLNVADYHLTAKTPTSIRDSARGSCPDTDYDRDPRPSTACDLGADEYIP